MTFSVGDTVHVKALLPLPLREVSSLYRFVMPMPLSIRSGLAE